MNIFFILLILYVTGLVIVSSIVNRDNSKEDYLIAGRNRPAWQIMFSKYAATVGGGWLMVYTGWAYEYGIGISSVFAGAVIGAILYALWAVPRIYPIAKKYKCYTQSDFVFALTQSKTASTLTDILVILMSVGVMVIAAVGGATLMESYSVLSYEWSVFIMIGVVLFYILLSGYKAVMLTDIIQGVMLLALLTLIMFSITSNPVPNYSAFFELRDLSFLGMLMLGLFGLTMQFADPNRYQVGFAAKSQSDLIKGFMHTIIPFLYTAFILYCIGIIVYASDTTLSSAEVFSQAISNYLPSQMVPFGLLVFFVAVMSSMDSFMYLIATHLERLVLHKISRGGTRIFVTIASIFIGLVALIFRDIIDVSIVAGAIIFTLAIPMIYLLHTQKRGNRFTIMVLGGIAGMAVGAIVFGFNYEASAFILLGNIIGIFIPTSIFTRSKTEPEAQ